MPRRPAEDDKRWQKPKVRRRRRKPTAAYTAPPPPPESKPAPSWTIPGPIVLCASDPDAALDPATGTPRAGVAAIGRIVVPGVAPVWRVDGQGRTGWLAQVEGASQVAGALDDLSRRPSSDSRAVIGTLNTPAAPFLAIGVNTVYAEINAQALPDGSGHIANQLFQGRQDGWTYVWPSFGVYDGVGLQHYLDELAALPEHTDLAGRWMVYSASGMSDTDSWDTLARLAV